MKIILHPVLLLYSILQKLIFNENSDCSSYTNYPVKGHTIFLTILYIIFTILFDDTSKFTETEKNKGVITNSISVNLLNCDTHVLISLINQTDNYKLVYLKKNVRI